MAQYINKDLIIDTTDKTLFDVLADGLIFKGTIGNMDTIFDAGLYRFANDNSKASSPFTMFNYGQVIVIPYRKGHGNIKQDYVVQIFFGDVDVSSYGGTMYIRYGYYDTWGSWYSMGIKRGSNVAVPTIELLDGKIVYTKLVKWNPENGSPLTQGYSKAHGISNYDRIWIDYGNSYMRNGTYIYPLPIVKYGTGGLDRVCPYIDGSNIKFHCDTNWGTGWDINICIKYTLN